MNKRYDLRKIYTLLVQGFSDEELHNFCLLVPEFRPIHDLLPPEANKDEIIRQIFEHARQTAQFDLLLAWAEKQCPGKYNSLAPYYDDPHPPGQYLGKYRLIERLGRGGMADVHKAYQTGLNRYVAIKAMHSHLTDQAGFIERFQREAAAVASLRHPNIVQVHDFFTEDDTYYMVMEFIEGPTLETELHQRKARGQLYSLAECVHIFSALTSAIDYAHSRGMIHRDLKPANIMFTADGQVVLTDFGIARIMGATRYTATGAVVGTPVYMSPEQAQGQQVDERSDIYSLGAILFEMVTGQILFEGDTPFAVVLKHVTEPPPHPTTINPNLPQPVEQVILKALSKNPNNRFQSAGKMAEALDTAVALANGQMTMNVPDTTPLSFPIVPDTEPLSPSAAEPYFSPTAKITPLPPTRTAIFINYKRNVDPDEAVAAQIYQALSQRHRVFIDQTMLVGERWAGRIEAELRRADFIITILSANSIHSEMIEAEIAKAHRLAQQQGRPVILPVRLAYRKPFQYPLSAYLDSLNWAFWQGPEDTPRLIEELSQAIAGGQLPIDEQGKTKLLTVETHAALTTPPPAAQPIGVAGGRSIRLEMPEGTMDPESKFYIERAGDRIALEAIERQGVTITIKAPRQMGKSSLLMRLIDAAGKAGKQVAFLDFQLFDHAALVEADTFFRQFCAWLTDELEVEDRIDEFWQQPLGNSQRCTRYMGRHLLKSLDKPLLLAMDEVDAVFDTNFRSDFFGMLRSWHNSRRAGSAWGQLDLALVTSTEPYQLIENLNQSPFNVGEIIELPDFTPEQVADLNQRHGSPLNSTEEEQLMALLGGHPYLSRRAFYMVAKQRITVDKLFEQATDDNGPFGDHLRHHSFRLHGQPELIEGLRQVIHHNICPDERVFFRLRGAGLVRRPAGGSTVLPRCQLYANYFRERLDGGG
ncbi:MAG: AAA-like domain-containing protein [Anaerolineae bacterium]|nr:AAA-like domain-containing protein [Anaerolineae bacterium]